MNAPSQEAAAPGWLRLSTPPVLIGQRCRDCTSTYFPPVQRHCRNPGCDGEALDLIDLPREGRLWSFTNSCYQPPPPYISPASGFVPFGIAAVEVSDPTMVILGQLSAGVDISDLKVGMIMDLTAEALFTTEDADVMVWRWKPRTP